MFIVKEQTYRFFGWAILVLSAVLALYWCVSQSGPTWMIMAATERIFDTPLVQISWILTFLIACGPGYIIKNYFEGLAWNAHVASLPPPDARESAKRSKYVKTDNLPPAPKKPVVLQNLPEGQEEFVVSCPTCGHFFSATRGAKDLKCPGCGEAVPVQA